MVHDNASAMLPTATFVLLLCRYTIAFVVLGAIAVSRGRFCPWADAAAQGADRAVDFQMLYRLLFARAAQLRDARSPDGAARHPAIPASFLVERCLTAVRSTPPARALTGLREALPKGSSRCVSPSRDSLVPALRPSGFGRRDAAEAGDTDPLRSRYNCNMRSHRLSPARRLGLRQSSGRGRWASCWWCCKSRRAVSIGATSLIFRLMGRGNPMDATSLFYRAPDVARR